MAFAPPLAGKAARGAFGGPLQDPPFQGQEPRTTTADPSRKSNEHSVSTEPLVNLEASAAEVPVGDIDEADLGEHGPKVYVLPAQVEGHDIRLEKHAFRQTYNRVVVKCNCSMHGRKCMKRRSNVQQQDSELRALGALRVYCSLVEARERLRLTRGALEARAYRRRGRTMFARERSC